MKVKGSQVGWGFWFQWVLASTVGYFVGWLMGFVLYYVPGGLIAGELGRLLQYFMLGAALGFGVSLMQWLILRRRVTKAGRWVLASTASFAVAGGGGYGAAAVIFGFSEGMEGFLSSAEFLGWTVIVALGGAVTGILQWLVLRAQISRAGWWVLASTVGWGLSMAVMGAFTVVGADPALGLPVGGAVQGAVTGGALVWLLRQPVPEA